MSITAYLRRFLRGTKPATKTRQARPRLGLENLEDRLVLSATSISGAAPNRVLTYQADSGEVNNLQISHQVTATTDSYTLTETGGVGIRNGSGTFTSVTFDSALFDRIDVRAGDKGDSVTVLSSAKLINVYAEDGNDLVTVGAPGRGMEDVTAAVVVDGGSQTANGQDRLILTDRDAPVVGPVAALTTLDYFADGGAITRQRLNFIGQSLSSVRVVGTGVEKEILKTSNQSDTIGVDSILSGASLEIDAGAGDDKVSTYFNMDLLAGSLTVQGEGGSDTLLIDDRLASADRTYAINTDTVSQGSTVVNIGSLEGLTIDAANSASRVNTFDVQSTNGLMPLTLNGGLGTDTVKMSDEDLTGIQTYNLNAGSLERWTSVIVLALPTADVNYTGVENMTINAGSSNDTFEMTDTDQPVLTINGNGGNDTLDYSAFSKNVYVNLFTGTLASKVSSFSGIENVYGGKGNDIIVGDTHDNVLVGNDGNDVIIGGEGADHISGGAGADLMIDGYTDFDSSKAQLQTIRNTWADTVTMPVEQDRVNALKVGIPGTSIQLSDLTVHSDGDRDVLSKDDPNSPSTPDWFWANPGNLTSQDDLPSLSGEFFK